MGLDAVFAEMTVDAGVARGVVRPEHARRLCEGHFPRQPIVPGAYLAGLMAELAATLTAPAATPAAVERCVFLARVAPDGELVVTARRTDPTRIDVEVHRHGACAARATFRFRAGT